MNVYNLVTQRAMVYQDASHEWVDANLGSKLTMKYPSCYLMEPGARGEILSLAFATEHQHQDTGGKVIHAAPHTTSKITSKSISKGGGRASYRGLLKVHAGASDSRSNVVCDALLLDEHSRSDTYPYRGLGEQGGRAAALLPDEPGALGGGGHHHGGLGLHRAAGKGIAYGIRRGDEPAYSIADGGIHRLSQRTQDLLSSMKKASSMTTKVTQRGARVLRRDLAAELPITAEDVKRVSARLNEPTPLAEARLQAFETYRSLPMPSTKEEAWRRTDIRALPAEEAHSQTAKPEPVEPALLEPLAADTHGALLVLRPGLESERRGEAALGGGMVFSDWATAVREYPGLLEAYAGGLVEPEAGKFAALAAAMAGDGALLYVPKGMQIKQPLHAIFWAPIDSGAFFSRLLVVMEEGASATLVYENASPTSPDGGAVHAGLVEVHLGPEAQLKLVELQTLGGHVWNFTHERAISGFYFTSDRQHLDHDTQQNHLAPQTTSDLLYKGALVDYSRSVWQGMIYVAPGAQKTDGYQANRNLLLSKHARADSIPGLEILADDVRCTHGATVSQIEQEPVYYLMTRGLPRMEAERVVVDGFFSPIMERIPFEAVRRRFEALIDAKLGARRA